MRYFIRRKIWFGSLSLIFVTSILFITLFYFGIIRSNYPSKNRYQIRGIDISHYQKQINWQDLQKEDITFIYIKATEGVSYKDSNFITNWNNGHKYNYKVGAYHFYLLCKPGIDQAKNFISSVPENSKSLPPVIDLEYGGNCSDIVNKESTILEIKRFLDTIKTEFGMVPVIYTTKRFYNDYVKDNFTENPIWIRDIFCEPDKEDYNWSFWQYSNRGRLKGINTYVDLNVFNGNLDDFGKLTNEVKTP